MFETQSDSCRRSEHFSSRGIKGGEGGPKLEVEKRHSSSSPFLRGEDEWKGEEEEKVHFLF